MKIRISKKWKQGDIDDMLKGFERKYGSLQSLQQKVSISKCTSPGQMGDFILWKNLTSGAEFVDLMVISDTEVFDTLSPRRAELLEYVMNNEVMSIRQLATALKRNYKNVYDDLIALSKYGLVDLAPTGRSLRPAAPAARIDISFES